MKTTTVLHAVALSLSLGLATVATAASAGDFEDAYPAFAEAQAQQQQLAAGQRVVIQAPRPKRNPLESVSTEASRALLGEDSGSFWMARQEAQPRNTLLARAAAITR